MRMSRASCSAAAPRDEIEQHGHVAPLQLVERVGDVVGPDDRELAGAQQLLGVVALAAPGSRDRGPRSSGSRPRGRLGGRGEVPVARADRPRGAPCRRRRRSGAGRRSRDAACRTRPTRADRRRRFPTCRSCRPRRCLLRRPRGGRPRSARRGSTLPSRRVDISMRSMAPAAPGYDQASSLPSFAREKPTFSSFWSGAVVLPAIDLAVLVVVDVDPDDAGAVHVAPRVDRRRCRWSRTSGAAACRFSGRTPARCAWSPSGAGTRPIQRQARTIQASQRVTAFGFGRYLAKT